VAGDSVFCVAGIGTAEPDAPTKHVSRMAMKDFL
jgi:hypothetical protein